MDLKKALELRVQYENKAGIIRVDENDYICLNDLCDYFPGKRLQHWIDNDKTQEFLSLLNSKLALNGAILRKRGKSGGTYGHKLLAMEFLTWLSPEFKLTVLMAFENGTQHKQDWNIKRIMAANNFKLMTEAIKNAHEEIKPYHYSNEALMLNEIVFGIRDGHVRDNATESQLDDISWLESRNGAYIEAKMSYEERKNLLITLYNNKTKSIGVGQ